MEHAHPVERQVERVGGDLCHDRFEALSDRGGTDIDRHPAIRFEVEPRGLLRPRPRPFDKTGDRDAVIAAVNQPAL